MGNGRVGNGRVEVGYIDRFVCSNFYFKSLYLFV